MIATTRARSLHKLDDLKECKGAAESLYTMELDVTASLETLKKKAEEAVGVWGRVDVVVNNAGTVSRLCILVRAGSQHIPLKVMSISGVWRKERKFPAC